jgi:hypothetical protein
VISNGKACAAATVARVTSAIESMGKILGWSGRTHSRATTTGDQ